MNINRHNYEEYFLLYADNELPAAEKNMVEAFLTANPDLQQEMQLLLHTILKPVHVVFENKEHLLKAQPVNPDIQQQLLLLLDNELAAGEKEPIQLLIKNEEAVKKEWDLLQQTKLPATDTLIFTDKASLYKKEEGRVIGFGWWRMAAAALLVGFGIWGTVSYLNNSTTVLPSTASSNNRVKPGGKTPEVTVPVQQPTEHTTPEKEASEIAIQQNSTNTTLPEKAPALQNKTTVRSALPDNPNNDMGLQHTVNNNPVEQAQKVTPLLQKLNSTVSNNNDAVNVQPEKKAIIPLTGKIDQAENKITTPNTYAVNTAFADNDDSRKNFARFDEEEDDAPKKTRIGGFFKKVKRVLERNAKIKTGNSDNIKIANMSFAMK